MRISTLFRIGLLMMIMYTSVHVTAQVRPGIKFGLSMMDTDPSAVLLSNDRGETEYSLSAKPQYGLHAGVFIQFQMGGFFIQPELLYNSRTIRYQLDSLMSGTTVRFSDSYRRLDIPFILGLKSGVVRLGGGPVAHLHLDPESLISNYDSGFTSSFENLDWGWQAGVGLDFWKLHVDVRYESNFNKLGDHFAYNGEAFDFDSQDARFLASLGFSF